MRINRYLVRSTVVGALGGLLFGFDTAVISGATRTLRLYFQLSDKELGWAVAVALWGAVVGAIFSGIPGERYGRRDSLRVMALFYFLSAVGCALAWNMWSLMIFRFIGGVERIARPHPRRQRMQPGNGSGEHRLRQRR